jgi:AcrR family transcriptional regulator
MVMVRARLKPHDWVVAALDALGSDGMGALAVEGLASRLGASKGSFYWHFADRGALIDAVVLEWEQDRTESVIEELDSLEDPTERLRRLFELSFANPSAGRVEAELAEHADDPSIGPALERVTRRRLAFLAAAFRDLGFGRAAAADRAMIAYSAFLGLAIVQRADGGSASVERFSEALLALLTQA